MKTWYVDFKKYPEWKGLVCEIFIVIEKNLKKEKGYNGISFSNIDDKLRICLFHNEIKGNYPLFSYIMNKNETVEEAVNHIIEKWKEIANSLYLESNIRAINDGLQYGWD